MRLLVFVAAAWLAADASFLYRKAADNRTHVNDTGLPVRTPNLLTTGGPRPKRAASPTAEVPHDSFNDMIMRNLTVDTALWRSSSKSVDVTSKVNDLISTNGIHDLTKKAKCTTLFGDIDPGNPKSLRIIRQNRYLDLPARLTDWGWRYDLGPLFEEDLKVDAAHFRSTEDRADSLNVTQKVNALLGANGARDLTAQSSFVELFGDPAPGRSKVLHVMKAQRSLDLRESHRGGPVNNSYDVTPLFLETGHLRPAKNVRYEQPISASVFVMSRRSAIGRRKLIRNMWQQAKEGSANLNVMFTLCSDNGSFSKEIDEESRTNGDVLILDCAEGYGKGALTKKVLETMRVFRQDKISRDFFMKVDDDTFVSWNQLASFIHGTGHPNAYIGIPIERAAPCRNPGYQWYEPFENFNETTFPESMAGGSGYVLGRALVHHILDSGIAEANMLWNEDRAVGVWIDRLQQRGVQVEFVALPGIDGWWNWDWQNPKRNWIYWADYPHLVHHGLHGETIACLAEAEFFDEPWRDITDCFEREVGQEHQPFTCTQGAPSGSVLL